MQCSRGQGSVLQNIVHYNAVLGAVQYSTVHSSAVQYPLMCAVLGPVNYWPHQPGLENSILQWGTKQEQKQEQKQKQEQEKEPKWEKEKEQKQEQRQEQRQSVYKLRCPYFSLVLPIE